MLTVNPPGTYFVSGKHLVGNAAEYKEEVRITYFHELGHYLGLEEDDLEERGL